MAQHDEAHVAVAAQHQALGQQAHAHHAFKRAHDAAYGRALAGVCHRLALAHERETATVRPKITSTENLHSKLFLDKGLDETNRSRTFYGFQ